MGTTNPIADPIADTISDAISIEIGMRVKCHPCGRAQPSIMVLIAAITSSPTSAFGPQQVLFLALLLLLEVIARSRIESTTKELRGRDVGDRKYFAGFALHR